MDDRASSSREAAHGVAFKTDLSRVGTSGSGSRLFAAGQSTGQSILEEEKRLIEKVFAIVDRDSSGSVDMEELKEMFKLFGVDSHFLTGAITRIMSNVDKDFDGMITPQEFYQLLSQKFEKGDPMSEIQSVFNRMDKNRDNKLDADELHEVSQMLGENITKQEVKEMIKMFSIPYQEAKKKFERDRKKDPHAAFPKEPEHLDLNDFYAVMQEEL
mmetsp:Transcript_102650/g.203776  ORF Transcript_102650/g.203776 Transcript_102650/m.203776 type:complete len:214 (-) Transcript_102650:140-781(-)